MGMQVAFMREALKLGIIDEWHVWNFARNEEDKQWLETEFSHSLSVRTSASSIEYQSLPITIDKRIDLKVTAQNDAHLKILMRSGFIYEIVLGAFKNTKHLARKFSPNETYLLHKQPFFITEGSIEWRASNKISIKANDGHLTIILNNQELFSIDLNNASDVVNKIECHTGYGSDGFWELSHEANHEKLISTPSKGYEGFKEAYKHYSHTRYSDSIFIKIDDDIVYCDLDEIENFCSTLEKSNGINIYSANVINNGVCAYLQSEKSYFPELNLNFEYPNEGLCGSLWENSTKCSELHDHFLNNKHEIEKSAKNDSPLTKLPDFDRFSINFIGFKHSLFIYMMAAYAIANNQNDDEFIMTKILPSLFGVRKFVYNHLLVSHLTFYKQEPLENLIDLLDRYASINDSKINIHPIH